MDRNASLSQPYMLHFDCLTCIASMDHVSVFTWSRSMAPQWQCHLHDYMADSEDEQPSIISNKDVRRIARDHGEAEAKDRRRKPSRALSRRMGQWYANVVRD